MRPALALSALLLLLLVPPPALSQDDASESSKQSATTKPIAAPSNQNSSIASTTSTEPTKTTTGVPSTLSSAQAGHSTSPKDSEKPVHTMAAPTMPTDSKDSQSSGNSTTTSQVNPTQTSTPSGSHPPSSSGQPDSSGSKDANVTTAPPAAYGRDQPATSAPSQPADSEQTHRLTVSPSQPSPAPTTDSTANPPLPTDAASPATESSSSHSLTIPSGSSNASSSPSPSFSVTPGKTLITAPPDTSGETQSVPSQTPGTSIAPSSTPSQPTESAVGTEVMSTVGGSTGSSTDLTPTTSGGPSSPSSIWAFREYKVKCDPAIMPDNELLTLNLTGASFCEKSPPAEKIVERLCRSVKTPFVPTQDECTLQVAPVLGRQAVVALRKVVIETKLSPREVFELLKDKWDALQEVGVSDMKLGQEGPPEPNEDRFSLPLIITIVCMASFLLLVAALYGCCHQRVSQRKDQQRLTEELQTVENGYHDNPTLEVMETPSEMQEKKVVSLNGELGDSWIVPLDNLTKDDLEEEEDTHL